MYTDIDVTTLHSFLLCLSVRLMLWFYNVVVINTNTMPGLVSTWMGD